MANSTAISADLRALANLLARGYLRMAKKAPNLGATRDQEDLDLPPETSPDQSREVDSREAS